MKRKGLFILVATLMAVFLVGSMPIGAGHPFMTSDNFIISDGENAALEVWSDLLEIYESETLDGRVDVNSFGVAKWKVRWASNETEVIDELTMIIKISGFEGEMIGFLPAEYLDGWWIVSYNYTEVGLLEFSVYSVSSYGMTEFAQLAENVEVIWDRIIVRVVNTNTNITTITIIDTDITTAEPESDIEIVQDMAMIVVGIVGMIAVIVMLFIVKEEIIK